jgi:hypothetical protein
MPRMIINSWAVSLVLLLSSIAKQKLSNSFALFQSWLSKSLLIS